MNCLMAGMVPVMMVATKSIPTGRGPTGPAFWFIMSMALLIGFITAYPMNWWLVSRHMKHGMTTVPSPDEPLSSEADQNMQDNQTPGGHSAPPKPMDDAMKPVANSVLAWMTILSFLVFESGLFIAFIFGDL